MLPQGESPARIGKVGMSGFGWTPNHYISIAQHDQKGFKSYSQLFEWASVCVAY